MNKDINFMAFTNLDELLEEHKKITHPYKKYEFDSTSYALLLCDINKALKENTNLKQALNEIKKCCEENAIEVNTKEYGNLVVTNIDDILQIIDKVLGDKK